MELKAVCENCKFWVAPNIKKQPDAAFGNCHRYPVAISILDRGYVEANRHGNAQWPRVMSNGWCGEFKPAITDKDIETLQEWAND